MGYLFLAIILFVIGLFKGRNINKEKIVSFSLKGGLIAGILSVVPMFIIGLLVAAGGTGVSFDIAQWFILGGGIGFAALYLGALISSERNQENEHEVEEQPEIEEDSNITPF